MIDFYYSVIIIWIVLISDTLKKNHVDKLSKTRLPNDINFVDMIIDSKFEQKLVRNIHGL